VTVKQRVVIIPGNQPQKGIYGYGGKDFEKRKLGKFKDATRKVNKRSRIRVGYDGVLLLLLSVVCHLTSNLLLKAISFDLFKSVVCQKATVQVVVVVVLVFA